MFTVHQLSLKSVEEKCENTAECCLQIEQKNNNNNKKNKTNKQTKKKQRSGRFTRIKTWLLSRVTDLQICLETTAQ